MPVGPRGHVPFSCRPPHSGLPTHCCTCRSVDFPGPWIVRGDSETLWIFLTTVFGSSPSFAPPTLHPGYLTNSVRTRDAACTIIARALVCFCRLPCVRVRPANCFTDPSLDFSFPSHAPASISEGAPRPIRVRFQREPSERCLATIAEQAGMGPTPGS